MTAAADRRVAYAETTPPASRTALSCEPTASPVTEMRGSAPTARAQHSPPEHHQPEPERCPPIVGKAVELVGQDGRVGGSAAMQ